MKRKQHMTAEEWIELAKGTDERRPEYQKIHGNFCADGFRIHLDSSLLACGCDFCQTAAPFIGAAMSAHRFTITKAALEIAAKQAIAIGKSPLSPRLDYIPPLVLTVNGRMEYRAVCEGNGEVYGYFGDGDDVIIKPRTEKRGKKGMGAVNCTHETVKYSHEGEGTRFAVNPNFLLDALSGMSDTVTVGGSSSWPIVITDGNRKAIIMPINL